MVGGALLEFEGGEGEDDDALLGEDGEGPFAGLVGGASELEDLHGAATFFLAEDVAEDDDVVGDELLDVVSADGAVLAGAFGGDDGGDAHDTEGGDEAEDFASDDDGVGEPVEEGAEGVDDDALGVDGADGVLDACEECAEVV